MQRAQVAIVVIGSMPREVKAGRLCDERSKLAICLATLTTRPMRACTDKKAEEQPHGGIVTVSLRVLHSQREHACVPSRIKRVGLLRDLVLDGAAQLNSRALPQIKAMKQLLPR